MRTVKVPLMRPFRAKNAYESHSWKQIESSASAALFTGYRLFLAGHSAVLLRILAVRDSNLSRKIQWSSIVFLSSSYTWHLHLK
jgi:hypothetical protein